MPDEKEWCNVWSGMRGLGFEKEPYMWKFYQTLLGDYDFRGKKVIEMGCGTGINTILMAKKGARVTFLDFSRDALDIVKRNMEDAEVDGEFILGNILDHDFGNEFDIVHSEGVIEHFRGAERQEIVNRHANALKKNGKAVLLVPQMGSAMYRIGKFISEKSGSWIHGYEYPYTRGELKERVRRAGLAPGPIKGGELLMAFGWMFSVFWLRRGTVLERSIKKPANRKFFRLNYNNWFADRYGRVLGVVGTKRSPVPEV
jgi:SAM-dependent methyltransferase